MSLAYGRHNTSFDDPVVQAVFRCLRRLGINLGPGLWKVDTYPFMKSVIQPGSLFDENHLIYRTGTYQVT
jgi:hypothetical protein